MLYYTQQVTQNTPKEEKEMGERRFLQIMTYRHWEKEGEFVTKTSFKTCENAIKDANNWINNIAKRWHRDVVKVQVINKDTNDIEWSWEA